MREPAGTELSLNNSATVTCIHIGDTHLTRFGEQNEQDLGSIIDEINSVYARGGVDFVFVPGDIADDGSVAAYQVFRKHLDRLELPWFAIVGDHDVHEKSFENFRNCVSSSLFSAFTVGPYRFLRLNAFSEPRPDAFIVDDEQLAWMERELQEAEGAGQKSVLFLHCYPSDLKRGGKEVADLIARYPVLLVDMGHTHYNEISNDGKVLYTATRSTGQIEEGPVGYSLTTLDDDTVSWQFVPLGSPSRLVITSPPDRRLLTERTSAPERGSLQIHAKIWSDSPVNTVEASLGEYTVQLETENGILWCGAVDASGVANGVHPLHVRAITGNGSVLKDSVELDLGATHSRTIHPVDQENAIAAWEERGLLGTQLGPNKNGRKW